MSEIVYLNGELLPAERATISVFDRGFLFADSVYEVIPFYQGKGFRLNEHLERLRYSLRALQIDADYPWQQILQQLIDANGGGNLSVYIQVSRGSAGRRSHSIEPSLTPTVFACCQPIVDIYQDPDLVAGIKVIVTADLRWHRCDIKSTCLLPNILVLNQARDAGAQEALLIRDGQLSEGASCNFFIVEQGVIYTPPSGSGILSGTTRALINELADRHGVPRQEANIDYSRLLAADEVWISSSTRGIVPVLEVDEQPINGGQKGPLWRLFFERLIRYQRTLMTSGFED